MYQIFEFDVRKGELKILSVFNTALESQLRTRLALNLPREFHRYRDRLPTFAKISWNQLLSAAFLPESSDSLKNLPLELQLRW